MLKKMVRSALKGLLSIKPCDRSLPSPSLLRADSPAYNQWLRASTSSVQMMQSGWRRSHAYWTQLEDELVAQLDRQYTETERTQNVASFSGETLFGMAVSWATRSVGEWPEKILKYVLASAKQNHPPARAICSRVYEALGVPHGLDESVILEWKRQAVSEGFLFGSHPFRSSKEYSAEKQTFRDNGGFCTDNFLSDKGVLATARDVGLLRQWIASNEVDSLVDSAGSRMMHVCAALGQVQSVEALLEHSTVVDVCNDAGETPLYKACQAGHPAVVSLLLHHGHHPLPSKSAGISPLHWLFIFPDEAVARVADELVRLGAADVNYKIKPIRIGGKATALLSAHFPFEWPLGTPFHWAAFARSKLAMENLLSLGADVDSTYEDGDAASTALAQVVYHGDVLVVKYLLEKGADAQAKDSRGRNLLHLMSFWDGDDGKLAGKFDSWVRHGNWEHRLQASQDVVQLLVGAGIDIECRTETYGNLTPLLQASVAPFESEHVICALLSAGADAESLHQDSKETILHKWISIKASSLQYPHAYRGLMRTIVASTKDLDRKGGWIEETALHLVANSDAPTSELLENLELLAGDQTHHADIDALDRDGYTPLMHTCISQTTTDINVRIQRFLSHGARPDLTNEESENVITCITDNTRLMDADSRQALEYLLAHQCFTKERLEQFVTATSINALAKACRHGKPLTVELLLSLGMDKRINSVTSVKRVEGTALDFAFYGADDARITYLRLASEFATDEEREEAEESGRLYAANAYGTNTGGQPSSQRAREAYWAYPKVFEILKKNGARRAPRVEGHSEGEPSYEDAVQLPGLGFIPQNQPNRQHWQALYDLETLQNGWEAAAFEVVKMTYEDVDLFSPEVMVFDRWPQIVDVLQPHEGWYKALLRDGTRVEVKLEDGKVASIRDNKGRLLDKDER